VSKLSYRTEQQGNNVKLDIVMLFYEAMICVQLGRFIANQVCLMKLIATAVDWW